MAGDRFDYGCDGNNDDVCKATHAPDALCIHVNCKFKPVYLEMGNHGETPLLWYDAKSSSVCNTLLLTSDIVA